MKNYIIPSKNSNDFSKKMNEQSKSIVDQQSKNNDKNLDLICDFSDNYCKGSKKTTTSSSINTVRTSSTSPSSSVITLSEGKRNGTESSSICRLYLQPNTPKVPKQHQFVVVKLIKQEPLDPLIIEQEQLNHQSELEEESDVEILQSPEYVGEQDEFHRSKSASNRVLLPNPLFHLRQRLNTATARRNIIVNNALDSPEPWEMLRRTSRTEPAKCSTTEQSAKFYIDVDKPKSIRSPYCSNLDTTKEEIVNIKQELDDNYQNNRITNARNQQEHCLTNNNDGNHFCRGCKSTFMSSNELITHLEYHPQNKQEKKKKAKSQPNCKQLLKNGSSVRPLMALSNSNFSGKNLSGPNEKATTKSTAKNNAASLKVHLKELRVIIPKIGTQTLESDLESDSSVEYLKTKTPYKLTPSAIPIASTSSSSQNQFCNLRRSSRHNPKAKLSKTASHSIEDRDDDGYKHFHACNYCQKTFKFPSTLKLHLVKHTSEKPFKCQICHKSFKRKFSLSIHSKIHQKTKASGGQFGQKCNLDRHLSTRVCLKGHFKCGLCNLLFTTKEILLAHVERHNSEDSNSSSVKKKSMSMRQKKSQPGKATCACQLNKPLKSYQCSYCPKTFVKKDHFVIHTRRHTGEKPYACQYCPMRFVTKTALLSHARTHTGEKPFQCPRQQAKPAVGTKKALACNLCHKKFKTARHLNIHLTRTHQSKREESKIASTSRDKLKRFPCPICPKSFAKSEKRLVHIRRHTGEKPHACEYCAMRFVTHTELVLHKRTHTGEKPFICIYPNCSRAFTIPKNLARHQLTHSKIIDGSYSCQACKNEFSSVLYLKRHQKNDLRCKTNAGAVTHNQHNAPVQVCIQN